MHRLLEYWITLGGDVDLGYTRDVIDETSLNE